VSCAARIVGDGPLRPIDADEAAAYDGRGFIWVHVDGTEEPDLAAFRRFDNIPIIAANALVATETRPRCDRIEDGAIVNLRGDAAEKGEHFDRLVSIRFWVRGKRVNSVTRRPLAAMKAVVALAEAGKVHDPGDLIAAFAREISRELDPQVADLGDTLDDCETELEPRNVYRLRRTIAAIRSEAIAFRRFVAPNRDALSTLSSLEVDWLADDDRLHIREASDRFARMAEELESVRERAALLHEQLIDMRAEQIDGRALLISIVALIFLPLTFITGLFGMNVAGIPIAEVSGAFWYITAFCVAVAIAIAAWFARKSWLRR
jgi:zinc transporter